MWGVEKGQERLARLMTKKVGRKRAISNDPHDNVYGRAHRVDFNKEDREKLQELSSPERSKLVQLKKEYPEIHQRVLLTDFTMFKRYKNAGDTSMMDAINAARLILCYPEFDEDPTKEKRARARTASIVNYPKKSIDFEHRFEHETRTSKASQKVRRKGRSPHKLIKAAPEPSPSPDPGSIDLKAFERSRQIVVNALKQGIIQKDGTTSSILRDLSIADERKQTYISELTHHIAENPGFFDTQGNLNLEKLRQRWGYMSQHYTDEKMRAALSSASHREISVEDYEKILTHLRVENKLWSNIASRSHLSVLIEEGEEDPKVIKKYARLYRNFAGRKVIPSSLPRGRKRRASPERTPRSKLRHLQPRKPQKTTIKDAKHFPNHSSIFLRLNQKEDDEILLYNLV